MGLQLPSHLIFSITHIIKDQIGLLAIKAVVDLSALLLACTTADLLSFATASNSKKTQQTVVQKTAWQIIKAISFGDTNLCLTLGAWIKPLFLAR